MDGRWGNHNPKNIKQNQQGNLHDRIKGVLMGRLTVEQINLQTDGPTGSDADNTDVQSRISATKTKKHNLKLCTVQLRRKNLF